MRSDKKNNGAAPLIVTIATAAAATVAVVILLISMGTNRDSDNNGSSLPNDSGFAATSELYSECENAAKELVSANYEVIRLFVTEGLPLESVYGKDPEPIDGFYVTRSEKYTKYSQIEALVEQIYTDDAAKKILASANGSGIYEDHTIHGDTFLGMNTEFSPDKDYKTDWSNCFIVAEPLSEDKCDITVYVDGVLPESAEGSPESVLKTEMIKTDGGWRFTEFLK